LLRWLLTCFAHPKRETAEDASFDERIIDCLCHVALCFPHPALKRAEVKKMRDLVFDMVRAVLRRIAGDGVLKDAEAQLQQLAERLDCLEAHHDRLAV
jgi:hypothetical protein